LFAFNSFESCFFVLVLRIACYLEILVHTPLPVISCN
jgi:hypothetical protein